MDSVEAYVESNVRMLRDTARMGVKIVDYLENGELGPLARQAMERKLERINYRIQAGIELVRAYRKYLAKQAQAETQPSAPEPQVEVPETIEARLVV